MIELKNDKLVFTFPEIHPEARLEIEFQRTLRIPDDEKTYPLPPGLGRFPLQHVDDHPETVTPTWLQHGGVMLPMYQSEALWLNFSSSFVSARGPYPFAIKVATGKVDAVTGKSWSNGLHSRPQDYMVAPRQPWLDGYCVGKGLIRQFVAMPLGSSYSAEEQITGEAEHGGLQIIVYPMNRDDFERRFPEREAMVYARRRKATFAATRGVAASAEMGLAPGGRMKQQIYSDPFGIDEWNHGDSSRCFVHIANSMVWESITGRKPPTVPPTAKQYTSAGLPWFDLYDETVPSLQGSEQLANMKSVAQLGAEKGDVPLPENETVTPSNIATIRKNLKHGQVREGAF